MLNSRGIRYREAIRKYSAHNRYLGMTVKEKRISIRDKSIIRNLMILTGITEGEEQKILEETLFGLKYWFISIEILREESLLL